MTSSHLYERALRLAGIPPVERVRWVSRFGVLVGDALRLLAEKTLSSGDFRQRELLKKDFTVSLVSGEASLLGLTNLTTEPLLPETISKVTHASVAGELHRVGSESSLNLERPTNFSYYAIEDNSIFTLHGGSRTALTGNVTLRGGFIPTLANVPSQLEPLLAACLVELGVEEKAA